MHMEQTEYKAIIVNKSGDELTTLLNSGWQMHGVYGHQDFAVFLLVKNPPPPVDPEPLPKQ